MPVRPRYPRGVTEPTVRVDALRRSLLDWYLASHRDLPWRRTRDPWAIWVSEVMLQQTRVEVVRDAYPRFLMRFPDPARLALASDDELLAAWAGLGYYRRARLLREGARVVARDHQGRVPSEPAAFAALPGIGAYTAGAVLSIAFDLPLPALDGNVERVLTRLLHETGNPRTATVRRRLRTSLEQLIPERDAGTFNQALMELGAMVCKPASPRCDLCPVRGHCRALQQGDAHLLPALPARRAAALVLTEVALVRRGAHVLAVRIGQGGVNEGFWELPGLGMPRPTVAADGTPAPLRAALERWVEGPVELSAIRGEVTHGITHHRITIAVREADGALLRPRDGARFLPPDDPAIPWTTVARKVFAARRRLGSGLLF
jgi:A/G-specific adenine glycosylase